jgi:hypothetical protein
VNAASTLSSRITGEIAAIGLYGTLPPDVASWQHACAYKNNLGVIAHRASGSLRRRGVVLQPEQLCRALLGFSPHSEP